MKFTFCVVIYREYLDKIKFEYLRFVSVFFGDFLINRIEKQVTTNRRLKFSSLN